MASSSELVMAGIKAKKTCERAESLGDLLSVAEQPYDAFQKPRLLQNSVAF